MRGYVVKFKDLYVANVGESSVDLVKEVPRYGLTDNLKFAEKQQKQLKDLLGDEGEIYVRDTITQKRNVSLEEVVDSENGDEKYYIFENDKLQAVRSIYDTGDIELSFQQQYKMTRVYQVERVQERLKEYGLQGYQLKEVTVRIELALVVTTT